MNRICIQLYRRNRFISTTSRSVAAKRRTAVETVIATATQQQQLSKYGTTKFLRSNVDSQRNRSVITIPPFGVFHQDRSYFSSKGKNLFYSDQWNWWSQAPLGTSSTTLMTMTMMALAAVLSTMETSKTTNIRNTCCDPEDATTTMETRSSAQQQRLSKSELTPSAVASDDMESMVANHNMDDLPIYTADDVARNDGSNGTPIWMSYGGIVYDVTNFIRNHPGGSEKILQAAGTAIEPFWYLYRQHFQSDLPMRLMERMAIGQLQEQDQNDIDEQMIVLEQDDPYLHEPKRNPTLRIHSDTPMNAEVPTKMLNEHYITPNDLFYIRNHHPVPYLSEKQIRDFRLQIDLSSANATTTDEMTVSFSLDDLKQMPKTELIVTLQCSGNRRGGFNSHQRTSGTPWGQGAVSTAKFTGVKLRDLLIKAGLTDPIAAQQDHGIEHVRFYAIDGMSASIDIEKALGPYGDCIVAYEMNDEPLPRDHGFPLRVVVPGYAAVRHVKWLNRIELSQTEAEGVWQRGLNYRPLPPSVTDASKVNLEEMPGISELSLYSGITRINRSSSLSESINPGDRITVKVGGWAYAGGGRNVIRVDVTGDNGMTWATATLNEGSKQRFRHAWAWVFWECDVPAVVDEDGSVHIASKAVDIAFNVQPESNIHMWNIRGLGNNSWYRAHAKVLD